jgi:hypothetical protein
MILIAERNEYPLRFQQDLIAIKCLPISEMATNRLLHHNADTGRKGVARNQGFQSGRRGLPRQRPKHRLSDVASSIRCRS